MIRGITATAPGFFAPQGRELLLSPRYPDMNERVRNFRFNEQRITNYEMETSALYGLGRVLGHEVATVCAIIANRYSNRYSPDYQKTIDKLIEVLLTRLTS